MTWARLAQLASSQNCLERLRVRSTKALVQSSPEQVRSRVSSPARATSASARAREVERVFSGTSVSCPAASTAGVRAVAGSGAITCTGPAEAKRWLTPSRAASMSRAWASCQMPATAARSLRTERRVALEGSSSKFQPGRAAGSSAGWSSRSGRRRPPRGPGAVLASVAAWARRLVVVAENIVRFVLLRLSGIRG
ncbi:hypothetical protein ACFFX0_15610 [Citricoccus parietis]|uniref:Uncharacterized protein n=1 Tax=Citricoccus parietis TaxID=592307 RepID=A0ABV5G0U5_9MICC